MILGRLLKYTGYATTKEGFELSEPLSDTEVLKPIQHGKRIAGSGKPVKNLQKSRQRLFLTGFYCGWK